MSIAVANRIPLLQVGKLSRSGNRYSVPVQPSQTVFAQYRHISGIAARKGQKTVSLTKIHLLNNLISTLQARQSKQSIPSNLSDSSPEQNDALIKKYSTELSRAVKATPVSFGTLGSTASAGMVFQTSA